MNTYTDPTPRQVVVQLMKAAEILRREGMDPEIIRRTFAPEWVRRAQAGQLVRKDMTGGAA